MIRRLYVHNFRCLENFELLVGLRSSLLLIGKNGSGKTTVGLALEILQKIARGTNRIADLVSLNDLALGRTEVPMRFEIEVELDAQVYKYTIAFAVPKSRKETELFVLEERLDVGGSVVYSRAAATLHLETRNGADAEYSPAALQGAFPIDWHLVALPIIQKQFGNDPIFVFKQWLARIVILRPVPSLIHGDSEHETLEPNLEVTNLGAWFAGLLAYAPSAYAEMDKSLKQVMPDLRDIKNPVVGRESRSLLVQFSDEQRSVTFPFADLSDGEKCFVICALVLAANHAYGPVLCFWDEPDNYLALSEVGDFVMALRQAFQSGGQFIATSHNPEAIRRFSDENTLVLYRKSHLEPTMVRPLSEIQVSGDLVGALVRGDLEP